MDLWGCQITWSFLQCAATFYSPVRLILSLVLICSILVAAVSMLGHIVTWLRGGLVRRRR